MSEQPPISTTGSPSEADQFVSGYLPAYGHSPPVFCVPMHMFPASGYIPPPQQQSLWPQPVPFRSYIPSPHMLHPATSMHSQWSSLQNISSSGSSRSSPSAGPENQAVPDQDNPSPSPPSSGSQLAPTVDGPIQEAHGGGMSMPTTGQMRVGSGPNTSQTAFTPMSVPPIPISSMTEHPNPRQERQYSIQWTYKDHCHGISVCYEGKDLDDFLRLLSYFPPPTANKTTTHNEATQTLAESPPKQSGKQITLEPAPPPWPASSGSETESLITPGQENSGSASQATQHSQAPPPVENNN